VSKYNREKHLETVLKHIISKYFYSSTDNEPTPTLIDLDGNNMIYGKDFIISPNDVEQPIQIKLITSQIKYRLSIPMINWNSYISNI
jgi:hypothetical protein